MSHTGGGRVPAYAGQADANRAFARRLAADSIAGGDDTGWFETLYAAAGRGAATVPWADPAPNPRMVRALADGGGGRAVVIGCGLGDDAEHVASLGFSTVAFDVSPTAVATARRRFPRSAVEYVTADLLSPPHSWTGAFDLVVEVYTLQVLTGAARRGAPPSRGPPSWSRPAAGCWSSPGRATSTTTRARCPGRSPAPRSSLFAGTG